MEKIDGTGQIVPEPDWSQVYSDVLEIAAASEHWRRVTVELRSRGLLSAANFHALERMVHLYVICDGAAKEIGEHGAVLKPKRSSPKAIARVSPFFTVLKEASSSAAMLESEFGLSPGKRARATGLPERKGPAKASDAYLKRVS